MEARRKKSFLKNDIFEDGDIINFLTQNSNANIRHFYAKHHDRIIDNRYNSPYWIRRYVHREIYNQFLPYIKAGQRVLDAGCGDGVLTCLAARQGVKIVGVDISSPNVEAAKNLAFEWNVRAQFLQADLENLPFSHNSFDLVISSHALEHLPHLENGLQEIYRVTNSIALIAMPTCLNPGCWALLGGDRYWKLGRRSIFALPIGIAKTIFAFAKREEGPNEGYAGDIDLPHIWRFPWVLQKQIESVGFHIERFEAGPLIIPYLSQYIRPLRELQRMIDCLRDRPILRNFGLGSMVVCAKQM